MSLLPLGLPEPLLSGPAPRFRVTPPSAPFLETLAQAMIDSLARDKDPFALADALVLLPNRRSARGLIDAFAKRLGGAALLPTIRPLGDPHADDDPDVWGAEPVDADLAPPLEKARRRMVLASLIRRRDHAENGVEDPVRALALADELCRLLDSAATVERVHWEKLPTLVEEIDLARHWAQSAAFLEIIAMFWPSFLKEEGRSDPAAHAAELRRKIAQQWSRTPPKRPVIIAGSTGSQATTRALMRAVAHLPRGVVVFPGVDVDLDEESWRLIGDQHPQHALKATLEALGVARDAIPWLALESEFGRKRRILVREALAPAEKTADWLSRLGAAGGADFLRQGAEGLRLLEAATEDEEATAIALMLREALDDGVSSAAVVTPDAALAKRIETKLSRWGITPNFSHGVRLAETEAGRLLGLLCELSADPGEPVALAALLKHLRVVIARGGAALEILEHEALRGPRRHRSLQDLAQLKPLEKFAQARALVQEMEAALAPLSALMSHREATISEFADALADVAERLTNFEAWRDRDGEAAARLLHEVREHGAALGLMPSNAAPRLMMALLDERELPPVVSADDNRVAIWGLLEARLQRRDLMILAGLNEGVWPATPNEDPFLSRSMRARLGLPSLDERIGLAAHDFAQLANAPRVALTRALRRDGAPTIASRWLWRLKTLMQGAGAELASADQYLIWAHALDQPAEVKPALEPKPRPPADKRLRKIGVTSVERLIRDPYAVYARNLLGLERLQPIGAEAGPAERGTAIHSAIERLADHDDAAALVVLFDEELRRAGVPDERRAAERERLRISADALIAWLEERRAAAPQVFVEKKGKLDLGDVILSGQADRIEITKGQAAILDFKTGDTPSAKQVESGLSPQLLLEAAMLKRGAFEDVPASITNEIIYWRLGNRDPEARSLSLTKSIAEVAEEALASLKGLLARYGEPTQAFLSKPRVQFVKPYADYDHLARRKEWADAEGGDA